MADKIPNIVTRFPPSPTGFLHIGNARTALFNWLLARHHGGTFLLRIEDTDKERHNEDAVRVIFESLKWMGLNWDNEPVFQSQRADRHKEIALELLKKNMAYPCYATKEELEEMREKARAEGRPMGYDGRWRNRPASDYPKDQTPVIRLKAPREGNTVIEDLVQGTVTVSNTQLDDMILLRSDGSPTYMLAVVVDDYDMGVTHVVRGDDHLNNAFRQAQIYDAMGWVRPVYAHLPLIAGPDGKKFSKRHGAQGVNEYRDMGYLPEALNNYLLKLGWGHGDDEIIDMKQAIEWFDFDGIGQAAARFDFAKLDFLNAHYLRQKTAPELVQLIKTDLEKATETKLDSEKEKRLYDALDELKERATRLTDLVDGASFLIRPRPLALNDKAAQILDDKARSTVAKLHDVLQGITLFNAETLEQTINQFVQDNNLKFKDVGMPLRAALTGSNSSPSIFKMIEALGKDETLGRLQDVIHKENAILAA